MVQEIKNAPKNDEVEKTGSLGSLEKLQPGPATDLSKEHFFDPEKGKNNNLNTNNTQIEGFSANVEIRTNLGGPTSVPKASASVAVHSQGDKEVTVTVTSERAGKPVSTSVDLGVDDKGNIFNL